MSHFWATLSACYLRAAIIRQPDYFCIFIEPLRADTSATATLIDIFHFLDYFDIIILSMAFRHTIIFVIGCLFGSDIFTPLLIFRQPPFSLIQIIAFSMPSFLIFFGRFRRRHWYAITDTPAGIADVRLERAIEPAAELRLSPAASQQPLHRLRPFSHFRHICISLHISRPRPQIFISSRYLLLPFSAAHFADRPGHWGAIGHFCYQLPCIIIISFISHYRLSFQRHLFSPATMILQPAYFLALSQPVAMPCFYCISEHCCMRHFSDFLSLLSSIHFHQLFISCRLIIHFCHLFLRFRQLASSDGQPSPTAFIWDIWAFHSRASLTFLPITASFRYFKHYFIRLVA